MRRREGDHGHGQGHDQIGDMGLFSFLLEWIMEEKMEAFWGFFLVEEKKLHWLINMGA